MLSCSSLVLCRFRQVYFVAIIPASGSSIFSINSFKFGGGLPVLAPNGTYLLLIREFEDPELAIIEPPGKPCYWVGYASKFVENQDLLILSTKDEAFQNLFVKYCKIENIQVEEVPEKHNDKKESTSDGMGSGELNTTAKMDIDISKSAKKKKVSGKKIPAEKLSPAEAAKTRANNKRKLQEANLDKINIQESSKKPARASPPEKSKKDEERISKLSKELGELKKELSKVTAINKKQQKDFDQHIKDLSSQLDLTKKALKNKEEEIGVLEANLHKKKKELKKIKSLPKDPTMHQRRSPPRQTTPPRQSNPYQQQAASSLPFQQAVPYHSPKFPTNKLPHTHKQLISSRSQRPHINPTHHDNTQDTHLLSMREGLLLKEDEDRTLPISI